MNDRVLRNLANRSRWILGCQWLVWSITVILYWLLCSTLRRPADYITSSVSKPSQHEYKKLCKLCNSLSQRNISSLSKARLKLAFPPSNGLREFNFSKKLKRIGNTESAHSAALCVSWRPLWRAIRLLNIQSFATFLAQKIDKVFTSRIDSSRENASWPK